MSKLTLEEVSTTYFDVLKEIGNIGAGNATTALASMLQSKVDMKVPNVMVVEFKDVGTLLEGRDAVREGIINEVGGLKDALDKLHEMIEE